MQGGWPFRWALLPAPPPSVSPREPARETPKGVYCTKWRAASGAGRGGAGGPVVLRVLVALDTEAPARGLSLHRLRLPWELAASLEVVLLPTNSQSSFPPGTVRGRAGGQRERLEGPGARGDGCRGCARARQTMRSSFFGGAGGGRGGVHLAGLCPGHVGREPGGAAGGAAVLGELKHRSGGIRLQSEEGPWLCLSGPAASLWGSLACPSPPPRSPQPKRSSLPATAPETLCPPPAWKPAS